MFVNYNLQEFGTELRRIRKELGYNQKDIQNKTGISTDTLRRIENGHVIPQYTTLELLSLTYRQDLLELLKSCRSSKLLMDFFHKLDSIIYSRNEDEIVKLQDEFREAMSANKVLIINPSEIRQFETLLEGARLFASPLPEKVKASQIKFLEAIQFTIPSFNIFHHKKYNYSYLEFRILFLYSLSIIVDSKHELSNEILHFILGALKADKSQNKYTKFLIIKIYSNIAYNYHNLDQHDKVLKYSKEGIAFCIKEEILHALHSLYYRKGIAKYHLKEEDYYDSLRCAALTLKISNQAKLLDIVLKVTKEDYDITIEV